MGCQWSKPKQADKIDPGTNEKDRSRSAFDDENQCDKNSREKSAPVSARSTSVQPTSPRRRQQQKEMQFFPTSPLYFQENIPNLFVQKLSKMIFSHYRTHL